MILPTRITSDEYLERQNGYNKLPKLYGLYLVCIEDDYHSTHLKFYLTGLLWQFSVYRNGEIMATTHNSYHMVTLDKLLEFVDHNTPECVDLLLYVLPNPSILFDPDFPTL